MADVTTNHESYDFSQHIGPLFLKGDAPRAFLRVIGTVPGFDGGETELRAPRTVQSNQFNVSVAYDLDSAAQPSIDEGADATFDEHTATASQNVVQIFQEGVQLSYSAMSNQDTIAEMGSTGETVKPGGAQGEAQFVSSLAWQIRRKREQIARDMNYTFLQGTYALGSAGVARQTRGLRNAISTNTDTSGTNRNLTTGVFEGALKTFVGNGMFEPGERIVAFAGADQWENLIDLYEPSNPEDGRPRSLQEAGVMIRVIWTKWGPVEVVYETDMAANEIILAQPQFLQAVFRRITIDGQSAGLVVFEKLATTGSASKWQLYLESGIDYMLEEKHGIIQDLNA